MRVLVVDDEPAFSEPLAERLALRGYDTTTAQDADAALAESLRGRIEALREQGVTVCRREDGLRHGADYVIACRPLSGHG